MSATSERGPGAAAGTRSRRTIRCSTKSSSWQWT
jgi:hypothetical protein